MAGFSLRIGKAVFLEVPRSILLRRLTGRRVCGSCGAVYHIDSKPTAKAGICDLCGGVVVQRKDDHQDVIATRLEAYDKSTSPLKQYFAQKGLFVEVDGMGATEDVYRRLAKQLV
jgi:adenylate kinase